ncbi:MAG: methyltransferase domain-containing protein [Acidobacteriota bacterium]
MKALKYVVVDEPLSEAEVHPPESYRQLVELSVQSAAELRDRRDVACTACGSAERDLAFEKGGYTYWSCRRCTSLFASPRPSGPQLDWYLHESPAARFRAREDYLGPLRQRALEVATVQGDWVLELLERDRTGDGQEVGAVVDLHTRFPEFLAYLKQRVEASLVTVEPLSPLPEALREDDAVRRVSHLDELAAASCRMVTAFNALEHLEEPAAFVRAAQRALTPGGLLAFTTRSSSGLDIQVLWERCPTVFPADHLNLLSVEGARRLLEDSGFELLEVSTPGQLDVELVERVLNEAPEAEGFPTAAASSGSTRFLRYLLRHRGPEARTGLQQFLQQHLLSSHLRVIARKPRSSGARVAGGGE